MRRKVFDKILTLTGAAVTVMLVVAGSLLFWGHSFANNNVHDELAAQKIFFPPAGSDAFQPRNEIGKYIEKYAGQQLTTGPQARAYANHFIAIHLKEAAGGLTYAEVSGKLIALQASDPKSPDIATLSAQKDTLFRGETLRGMLLNAYAWWKMGQIALVGAIVSYALAGVMLLLTAVGAVHLRRVSPEAELFAEHTKSTAKTPVAAH